MLPLGNTWYDSFQLSVTQRFSHGLSFNLNYNFSKNLDTMERYRRRVQPRAEQEPVRATICRTPCASRAQYVVPQ